jgi:hypothetical protein
VQLLGPTIDLPAAENVKRLTVHDEHPGGSIGAILTAAAERADIDAFRTAMDSMGSRVAGLLEHLLGLDDLVDFCPRGIGLGIDDIDTRGAKPGDDQIPALEECVAGERRQCR